MSTAMHPRAAVRRTAGRRDHNPLAAPLLLFAAVVIAALGYITYVLWPRWPDVPVAGDAPSLPIVIAGTGFNIEPAAIRVPMQRRPGVQERVDLDYLWPSLLPPDPRARPTRAAAGAIGDRLFVTITSDGAVLSIEERMRDIYPRYLAPGVLAGPEGLTLRPFRDDSPYRGEDLVFESAAPAHFFARCSRHGVANQGTCLLERRIGGADVTVRFPREWLEDWRALAAGIDRLLARMHPS